jgi:hypothetical protein
MEFEYRIKGDWVVVKKKGDRVSVELSKESVEKMTEKIILKSGLDYDTAFDLAVYLSYLKVKWE